MTGPIGKAKRILLSTFCDAPRAFRMAVELALLQSLTKKWRPDGPPGSTARRVRRKARTLQPFGWGDLTHQAAVKPYRDIKPGSWCVPEGWAEAGLSGPEALSLRLGGGRHANLLGELSSDAPDRVWLEVWPPMAFAAMMHLRKSRQRAADREAAVQANADRLRADEGGA